VAAIFFPIVLVYQGWSLWIFRKRLVAGPATASAPAAGPAGPPVASTGDRSGVEQPG
jgi:hypothetical protein